MNCDIHLIDDYRTWLDVFLLPGSVKNRVYYATRYLNWLSDRTDVSSPWETTPQQVSEFIIHSGKAPSTKKNIRDALSRFYQWGIATRQTVENPVSDIPRIRVPSSMPRPTPLTAIDEALNKAPRLVDVLMILLGVYSGLRSGEISALHTNDFQNDQIRVTGKGQKERFVPMHQLIKQIVPHLHQGWVFPSPHNPTGHYLPASVSQRLGDMLGPNWSGHTLRHRFATDIFADTKDILLVQELLGHESITATRIYTKANVSNFQPAIERLQPTAPAISAAKRVINELRTQA